MKVSTAQHYVTKARTMIGSAAFATTLVLVPTMNTNYVTIEPTANTTKTPTITSITRTGHWPNKGYWIEWSDGGATGYPSRKVALRECRADYPAKSKGIKRCSRHTIKMYRNLANQWRNK